MAKKIRTTFGIKDKLTGKQYPDIIKYACFPRIITCEDFDIGYIRQGNFDYVLDTDKKVRTELGNWGACRCMVSYQIRKDILIAVARIYKTRLERLGQGE